MCNLYRMTRPVDEIARMFGVAGANVGNAGGDQFPGQPGLVFDGTTLRSMVWGFPYAGKGARGQLLKPRPVNNARADRLHGGFWRPSFETRRCLIPLEAFAEAQGPKGRKTRVWFSLPDQPIFTAAAIWRISAEWGPVYAMIMTEACQHVLGVHDRMPVLLDPADRERWLTGEPAEAYELCRPYQNPMLADFTDEPWTSRR